LRLDSTVQTLPEGSYFFVGQGGGDAMKLNEAHNALDLQGLKPVAERHAHENVSGEQRKAQDDAAILPAADRRIEGQEVFQGAQCQLLGHAFFVISGGVEGIPSSLAMKQRQSERVENIGLRVRDWGRGHSCRWLLR